jgi:ATP-dependent Lon protease
MPKISPTSLAKGVGFVTDYFGELLVKLRDDDHKDRLRSVKYQAGMTKRDQNAVERVGSGLIKLIYPDGVMTPEELDEVADLACEMRQRVHNQLNRIAPGEFKPRLIAREGVQEHAAADLKPRG